MPTYKDPVHGVSISEAAHEAAVIAPIGRPMLNTFEIWHPSMAEPLYLVRDKQSFFATKEATADRDAGLEVEFLACAIEAEPAEESDNAPSPETQLTIGNVMGPASDARRAAIGSLEAWEIIERLYAADDPSGPARLPPTKRLLTNIGIDGEAVTATASFGDLANVSVPRTTFKRSEHPGLVR